MVSIGVDEDGEWFVWDQSRPVGKTARWSPVQERIVRLGAAQVRSLVANGVKPDWVHPSLAEEKT